MDNKLLKLNDSGDIKIIIQLINRTEEALKMVTNNWTAPFMEKAVNIATSDIKKLIYSTPNTHEATLAYIDRNQMFYYRWRIRIEFKSPPQYQNFDGKCHS